MTFLFLLAFVPAYVVTATWAARSGGPRRLWGAGAVALLAIVALAVLAGRYYAVPSTARVVLYEFALLAPSVILTNVLLSSGPTSVPSAARAIAGAGVGLVCGYLLVVFGLGVW